MCRTGVSSPNPSFPKTLIGSHLRKHSSPMQSDAEVRDPYALACQDNFSNLISPYIVTLGHTPFA